MTQYPHMLAPLDLGFQRGHLFEDRVDGFFQRPGLDLQDLPVARERPERPPELDPDHRPYPLIAARMRGGDMGVSLIRTPMARETAFEIAASGGTIEVSPTPRTP